MLPLSLVFSIILIAINNIAIGWIYFRFISSTLQGANRVFWLSLLIKSVGLSYSLIAFHDTSRYSRYIFRILLHFSDVAPPQIYLHLVSYRDSIQISRFLIDSSPYCANKKDSDSIKTTIGVGKSVCGSRQI